MQAANVPSPAAPRPAPSGGGDVVSLLNALLNLKEGSVIRFLTDGFPYLDHAAAELVRPLRQMVERNARQIEELAQAIDDLNGVPVSRPIRSEEQYLAYLKIEYLLPRLLDAKREAVAAYSGALPAVAAAGEEFTDLLKSHITQDTTDLAALTRFMGHPHAPKP